MHFMTLCVHFMCALHVYYKYVHTYPGANLTVPAYLRVPVLLPDIITLSPICEEGGREGGRERGREGGEREREGGRE